MPRIRRAINRKGVAATTPRKYPYDKYLQDNGIRLTPQQSTILSLLMDSEPFTKKEVAEEHLIWALATRISELKKLGVPIDTLYRHPQYNQGRRSRLAIYVLSAEEGVL